MQPASPASAQSQTTPYWRYPTESGLSHVLTADINHDGIDEFLIVERDSFVTWINADGSRANLEYIAPDPVLALTTADIDGPGRSGREIVLATHNRLILLTASLEEMWQVPVTTIPLPPALRVGATAETITSWNNKYEIPAAAIFPFDFNNDGREEILVLLESGQVQLYDNAGELLWRYTRSSTPGSDTQPQIATGDLDGDGESEIVLGLFSPNDNFSKLMLIDRHGRGKWPREIDVSRRITALTLASFSGQEEQYIAVGTNGGDITLYNSRGSKSLWPRRTVNVPVTSLTSVRLPAGPALAVGTQTGTVIVFGKEGFRHWTAYLSDEGERRIMALRAAPLMEAQEPPGNQPILSVIMEPRAGAGRQADMVLLAADGRTLKLLPGADTSGQSRLTDINHDRQSELLLVGNNGLELAGLGLGPTENAQEWRYPLNAAPLSFLVADLNGDGEEELLVGGEDGRLHFINKKERRAEWIVPAGGAVTHLALLSPPSSETPNIVSAHNSAAVGPGSLDVPQSHLIVRNTQSDIVWQYPLLSTITSLLVGNFNEEDQQPEIVVGTANGDIFIYTAEGHLEWQTSINGRVTYLRLLKSNEIHSTLLIAATANQIFRLAETETEDLVSSLVASYEQKINDLHVIDQPGNDLGTTLLVFVDDGTADSVTWQGERLPQWPISLGGSPTLALRANETTENTFSRAAFEESTNESFLVATGAGQLLRLEIRDNRPGISTRPLSGLGEITALYWGDLNGDELPDIGFSTGDGQVHFHNRDFVRSGSDDLFADVFALTALKQPDSPNPDLLIITENGENGVESEVQLWRVQENLPPLLTAPTAQPREGQYVFSVAVQDAESDDVRVRLEILNPETGVWEPQNDEKIWTINTRSRNLTWSLFNPQFSSEGVHYRFHYQSEKYEEHQGYLEPPVGPRPLPAATTDSPLLRGMAFAAVLIIGVAVLYIRQTQSPAAQAHRFYRRIQQQPRLSLLLLEHKYATSGGSPDFLLHLANQARQNGDQLITSLADGLFLLANRPHAGLSIINSVLEAESTLQPSRHAITRWRMTYKVGQALLEAPSITELSLLRPQLVQLLTAVEKMNHWAPGLQRLLPILTHLRDSERVERADDRLVYLNEAVFLLEELQDELPDFPPSVEQTLIQAIVRRWLGLANAEIEDLRGRAELAVTLKTRRLVPNGRTDVALEISNNGRAAAENVIVALEENPAYKVFSTPQTISFLPPGRMRQVRFVIEPQVNDHFRMALTVTYDDRNRQDKEMAFGDMIHLLSPVRDFKPIDNPYMPGTPLRRDSGLFYGRQQLFDFIAENVGRPSQRNVLILIGQRRTGKTSVLLRLEEHLPDHLWPVYIDCQSLGVTPGMPALFHDLAWHISDTLAAHHIDIEVPPPHVWEENPTGRFQRHFLTQVKALLPLGTVLLLVFDEFEAFENLVNDGILPPTFFPYMRHLMQHSERINFVFVGTRRLEEMSADYWSVLFNIALYKKIGYLSKASATRLITEPVAPSLIYDDLALDKILRVTAAHPYFLQLVCYTLVKQANDRGNAYITISDVNAALDEMLRLGEVHFAYIWQRSAPPEKALLMAVAHLMDGETTFHPADLMQFLESYGIRLNPTEVTAALNQLVEREIMREVPEQATTLYELKAGLIGLWVAKNKSLSKLYATNGEWRT